MVNRIDTLIEAEARRADKVKQLVTLLRDPDLADFVAKLASGEEPGLPPGRAATAPTWPMASSQEKPTTLRGMIRELQLPAKFTSKDVLESVHGKFHFNGGDPLTMVRSAIYTLSRTGPGQAFRVVKKSVSGSEQVYERIS